MNETNSPQSSNPLPNMSPVPPTRHRRRTAITIVIIIVVIALSVWAFMTFANKSSSTNNKPQQALAPVSVVQNTAPGEAKKYGATSVFDACQLLTIADLKELGFDLVPKGRYILRSGLTDDVPAGEAVVGNTLTADMSACAWPIAKNGGEFMQLSIQVEQPPLSNVKDTIRTQNDEFYVEKGAQVSIEKSPTKPAVRIQLGETQVRISGSPDRTVSGQIVSKIIDRLTAGPTARAIFGYPGSFRDIVAPCTMLTEAHYQQLFNKPSSRLPQESLYPQSVIGSYEDGASAAQLVSRCLRDRDAVTGLMPQGLVEDDGNELTMQLITYDSEESAKRETKFRLDKGDIARSNVKLGDQSFIQKGTDFSDPEKLLCFQKGRYVVCTGAFVNKKSLGDQAEIERLLQPVAIDIARKLP